MKTSENKKQAWKPRSHTPESLYAAFVDYVAWSEANPMVDEAVSKGHPIKLSKVRPLTLTGFCNFANIHVQTFRGYESQDTYSDVCARARAVIEEQQLSGAMVGRFNPTIVARVLSLVDRADVTTNGNAIPAGSGVSVVVDKDALSILRSAGSISIAEDEFIKTKG